jgi:hypothetical protein
VAGDLHPLLEELADRDAGARVALLIDLCLEAGQGGS